ncbi:MAG: CvpA family protein [Fidelibacterota bacterium]
MFDKYWLDIVILAILSYFTISGLRRGIVEEIFRVVGVIVAFLTAGKWFEEGVLILKSYIDVDERFLHALSFIAIFIITVLLFRLAAKFVKTLLRLAFLGWIDKTGGAFFGLIKGALIISLIILLISFLPLKDLTARMESNSTLYNPLKNFAPGIYDFVIKFFPDAKNLYDKVKEKIPEAPDIKNELLKRSISDSLKAIAK